VVEIPRAEQSLQQYTLMIPESCIQIVWPLSCMEVPLTLLHTSNTHASILLPVDFCCSGSKVTLPFDGHISIAAIQLLFQVTYASE